MRTVLAIAMILGFALPAHAEYREGDKLLECLVGKGAVEMRHGAKAEAALKAVLDTCQETASEPEPSVEPEGEWGDYFDTTYSDALDFLTASE